MLFRGLRQWHGIEGSASEPGRPCQVSGLGVSADKPEKGKEVETPVRESDMLIVAKKQGNACGAKGHALPRRV